MITAVDSSVLLDVLIADPRFCAPSLQALRTARTRGGLLACPIVWAEIASRFDNAEHMGREMSIVEVEFDPFDAPISESAGRLWKGYRRAGGKRERVLADFFVGAHALARGGRLLSRDSGFYRRYFRGLQVLS